MLQISQSVYDQTRRHSKAHWLGCSYLITAIVQGRAIDTHAFHLAGRSEEDKYFEQEILILE